MFDLFTVMQLRPLLYLWIEDFMFGLVCIEILLVEMIVIFICVFWNSFD